MRSTSSMSLRHGRFRAVETDQLRRTPLFQAHQRSNAKRKGCKRKAKTHAGAKKKRCRRKHKH